MHRSGTSVVAALADAFGLYGGPRDTMLSADQFNSDGYWEQRALVEFHDEVLRRLGGFASAPPAVGRTASADVSSSAYPIVADLLATFDRPWFLKDPRQCLLLDVWQPMLDRGTLNVVVSRHPNSVIRSLQHRNGYSRALAMGMWGRYTAKLLEGVDHKPCYFVQYEHLLREPIEVTAGLTAAIGEHFPQLGDLDDTVVTRAAALIRPLETASSTSSGGIAEATEPRLEPEHEALYEVMRGLSGHAPSFECPPLPPLSPVGERAIRNRRVKLFVSRAVPRLGSRQRARLDRRQ